MTTATWWQILIVLLHIVLLSKNVPDVLPVLSLSVSDFPTIIYTQDSKYPAGKYGVSQPVTTLSTVLKIVIAF